MFPNRFSAIAWKISEKCDECDANPDVNQDQTEFYRLHYCYEQAVVAVVLLKIQKYNSRPNSVVCRSSHR